MGGLGANESRAIFPKVRIPGDLADFVDEEQEALGLKSPAAVILHHLRRARALKQDASRKRDARARRRSP